MEMIDVGIDIGGTFTDVVAYVEDDHRFVVTKVPSIPRNGTVKSNMKEK